MDLVNVAERIISGRYAGIKFHLDVLMANDFAIVDDSVFGWYMFPTLDVNRGDDDDDDNTPIFPV